MDVKILGFHPRQVRKIDVRLRPDPREQHPPLPGFSSERQGRQIIMINKLNHRTAASAEAPLKPLPPAAPAHAYAQKFQVLQRLTIDILSRIEQLFHDDPAGIVGKQSGMLPREIEDTQAYFLQKTQHARDTLRALSELLQLTPEPPEARELVSTELMLLFVLVESFRPQRIQELGWKPDQQIQDAIREKIEAFGLDIINMRERLK
jgi:hypothetical protein